SGLAFGSAVAGGSCRSLVAGTTARLPRLVGPPSGRVPYLVELRLRRGRRGLWRRGAEIGAGHGHRRRVRGCRWSAFDSILGRRVGFGVGCLEIDLGAFVGRDLGWRRRGAEIRR